MLERDLAIGGNVNNKHSNDMEDKMLEILLKYIGNPNAALDARKELLDLFSVSGSAIDSVFDDKIDEWHESDSKEPLHEYLGLTKEQYILWLSKPELVEKYYR